MTVQQFGTLYKAFKIYPNSIVEKFLSQYVLPSDIDLTEPTWRSFFGDIVSRFPGARHHGFLFNFLDTVSCVYLNSQRHQEFVFHLLEFRVPKLFAVDYEECDEEVRKVDAAIGENFRTFLYSYITSNCLKNTIITKIARIMVSLAVSKITVHF